MTSLKEIFKKMQVSEGDYILTTHLDNKIRIDVFDGEEIRKVLKIKKGERMPRSIEIDRSKIEKERRL